MGYLYEYLPITYTRLKPKNISDKENPHHAGGGTAARPPAGGAEALPSPSPNKSLPGAEKTKGPALSMERVVEEAHREVCSRGLYRVATAVERLYHVAKVALTQAARVAWGPSYPRTTNGLPSPPN